MQLLDYSRDYFKSTGNLREVDKYLDEVTRNG